MNDLKQIKKSMIGILAKQCRQSSYQMRTTYTDIDNVRYWFTTVSLPFTRSYLLREYFHSSKYLIDVWHNLKQTIIKVSTHLQPSVVFVLDWRYLKSCSYQYLIAFKNILKMINSYEKSFINFSILKILKIKRNDIYNLLLRYVMVKIFTKNNI